MIQRRSVFGEVQRLPLPNLELRGIALRSSLGALLDRLRDRSARLPMRVRLTVITLTGGLGTAVVAYLTAVNPDAGPPHAAAITRASIVVTLLLTGMYALTSRLQRRMGTLLIATGFFSLFWLLNGSSNDLAFSVGVACAGIAPTLFCYIMLAHPQGRLRSVPARRVLLAAGGSLLVIWLTLLLTSPRAPVSTPLVRCAERCPHDVFFVGVRLTIAPVLRALLFISWLGMTCWTAAELVRRMRAASGPMRSALGPVMAAGVLNAALLIVYMIAHSAGSAAGTYAGGAYVASSIIIPLAVLAGLVRERLDVAAAVAEFVSGLGSAPDGDPEALMASALGDPSLKIAYRRPRHGTYIDISGAPVSPAEDGTDRGVTWIERGGRAIAAVSYAPTLCDQQGFMQAAGTAAMMQLERGQLEADLRASTADLEESRIRLLEAAHEERRRIERDLHDTVQQQLVGLRFRLETAAQVVRDEPERGDRLLAAVGDQIDDVLETLRNLARGIYPALLNERGTVAALRAAAQRLPIAVAVRAKGVGRYPEDIEVAVYFCCLEALQNVVKHAGPNAAASIRLWRNENDLCFEVRDNGCGFDIARAPAGSGLTNMRDRIETIGGEVTVESQPDLGTHILGRAPIALRVRNAPR